MTQGNTIHIGGHRPNEHLTYTAGDDVLDSEISTKIEEILKRADQEIQRLRARHAGSSSQVTDSNPNPTERIYGYG